MLRFLTALVLACVVLAEPVTTTRYHLSARPWTPLGTPREAYLDVIQGLVRFSVRHLDASGAIIDPYLRREHQYATPYFAHAVATLVAAGRGKDFLEAGMKAMDHATLCFAGGQPAIPDQHGNFFIAALAGALEQFRGHVPEERWNRWYDRMRTPRAQVISEGTNNWETYVMKGEWMRAKQKLAERSDAIAFIEGAWIPRQRLRIAEAPWRLYHDRTSDPDTLSVEAVGRGNLLALVHLGYNGPSARQIRQWVEPATRFTLYLQDPSGQVPANGRTDNHVWVEAGYQLAFEVMAERSKADSWLAGQFRRAALLSFDSIRRWRRADGSYYVTKNRFDPALRVGYQDASQYSNYNGSLMFHLAEAYLARQSVIEESPAPSEIGGYAIQMDDQFATAFANAGGMQMQVNLRGQTGATHGNRWTPLGVVRFARSGWETRLGPSDGALTDAGGVSFAPAFREDGRWLRMADLSSRYEGRWETEFVHPLLVRCAVTYWPRAAQRGPMFRNEFVVTPDGILSVVKKVSPGDLEWGVTWPLLANDGQPLAPSRSSFFASTGYAGTPDRQNFLALDAGSELQAESSMLRSSYGDLLPVRVTVRGDLNRTWIYPSGPGDPNAEAVGGSFAFTRDGFRSVLGRVEGNTYVGRTAAGGFADRIDLDEDGVPDVTFSGPCGFFLELRDGKIQAIEADRWVRVTMKGRKLTLSGYTVVRLSASGGSARPERDGSTRTRPAPTYRGAAPGAFAGSSSRLRD